MDNKPYIIYKCRECNRHFILYADEVEYTEEEATYITCPYHGKHHNIIVVGAFEDVIDCMGIRKDTYSRIGNRVRQTGWGK